MCGDRAKDGGFFAVKMLTRTGLCSRRGGEHSVLVVHGAKVDSSGGTSVCGTLGKAHCRLTTRASITVGASGGDVVGDARWDEFTRHGQIRM